MNLITALKMLQKGFKLRTLIGYTLAYDRDAETVTLAARASDPETRAKMTHALEAQIAALETVEVYGVYRIFSVQDNVSRYIGLGDRNRPLQHFKGDIDATNKRLYHFILRQRNKVRWAWVYEPVHIRGEVVRLEAELIHLIGREDLGTWPLFNNTNGAQRKADPDFRKRVREHLKRHLEKQQVRRSLGLA